MSNEIKIGDMTIIAKCFFDVDCGVFCSLYFFKNSVPVAQISPLDIDRKIKPENRGAVKSLVKTAVESYVLTNDDIAAIERRAKSDKIHREYIAHYNKVIGAMSV